jgi:hypothetical protein
MAKIVPLSDLDTSLLVSTVEQENLNVQPGLQNFLQAQAARTSNGGQSLVLNASQTNAGALRSLVNASHTSGSGVGEKKSSSIDQSVQPLAESRARPRLTPERRLEIFTEKARPFS